MSRHALSITLRRPSNRRRVILRRISWLLMMTSLAGCAPSRQTEDPQALTANQSWVQNACRQEAFDPASWPRYEYHGLQIAVPAPYKQTSAVPEYLHVRTPRGSLTIRRHREARYDFDMIYKQVHPGQVSCAINYGRMPAEVVSWHERGQFRTAIRVEPQWAGGDGDEWLFAIVRSTELSDATMLRHVLRTITAVPQGRESADAWFDEPCLPDSADDFEWTRYDLHGIRIRVPREVTHVKHPSIDELHFRIGRSTMRLRLHRDASALFADYYTPPRTRRHCWGDVGGLMAEAISFGAGGGRDFGFAARWADADRSEWLAAVIHGTRLNEVTLLRRTLFTIAFPGEKGPF